MTHSKDNRTLQPKDVIKSVIGQKYPLWVRTWRSVHLGWLVALIALSGGLAATVVAPVLLLGTSTGETLLLTSWLMLAVIIPLSAAVVLSGAGSARLSRFVRSVDVAGVGRGLAVPGRGRVMYRTGVLATALLAAASYVQWGADEPVNAARHQFQIAIMAHFGTPICLLFFALSVLVVDLTRISLHPEGIVQEIYRRRGWKSTTTVTVVPWDSIIDLQPQTHPDPAMSHPHWYPTIRVVYREPAGETDQMLILMACEKKVEPNALLAVVTWCRDNSWARAQLAHGDARELLRPPRFLDRIEADRAATMSGRRDVR